ncbi:hypothetical protein M7M4_08290 [Corynebacterium pseudogenitalium]
MGIVEADLQGDYILRRTLCRFWPAAVPPDSVAPGLRHINEGIGANQSNPHLVSKS